MDRLVLALLLALLPSIAWGQAKRVALVIGNSAYQHTPRLANPKNDANDVSGALKSHGFQVLEGFDLEKAAFDRRIREFADALQGAEVGVFFYAGHGVQVAGQNYLVPVDARLSSPAALDFEMVPLYVVQKTMERDVSTNILFLDACRDNPLRRNLAQAMGARSLAIGRGLAASESGVGTLISFSTQPGNIARDGEGRNSPYARALVKQLSAAADDLSAILISVRNDVIQETQGEQVPWEHSALRARFYFKPAASVTRPPTLTGSNLSGSWDITSQACQNRLVSWGGGATWRIQVVQNGQQISGSMFYVEPPSSYSVGPLSGSIQGTSFVFTVEGTNFLSRFTYSKVDWSGEFIPPSRMKGTINSPVASCSFEGLRRE